MERVPRWALEQALQLIHRQLADRQPHRPVFTQEREVVLPVTRNTLFSQALTLNREHASPLMQA